MNLMKMMGNLGNLAKMQKEMQAVQAQLAEMTFEGKAGADMVQAKVNGQLKVQSVTIDPQLLADGDKEVLEDLVVAAMNDALDKARKGAAEITQEKLADSLGIPGMGGLIGSMLPK